MQAGGGTDNARNGDHRKPRLGESRSLRIWTIKITKKNKHATAMRTNASRAVRSQNMAITTPSRANRVPARRFGA